MTKTLFIIFGTISYQFDTLTQRIDTEFYSASFLTIFYQKLSQKMNFFIIIFFINKKGPCGSFEPRGGIFKKTFDFQYDVSFNMFLSFVYHCSIFKILSHGKTYFSFRNHWILYFIFKWFFHFWLFWFLFIIFSFFHFVSRGTT